MDSAGERGRAVAAPTSAGNAQEPMVLPPTSVIIPTRNRRGLLHDTVRSILDGEELPAELIVADQSDAPDEVIASMGSVRGCEVRYLRAPGVGVSRARNAGMRAARTDILAFADDDVLVDRTWLGSLVRALQNAGPHTVVTGRVLPETGGKAGWFAPSLRTDELPESYEGRIGRDVLFSANMGMFRTTATAIGGFDERLRRAQDNDYGFRLLEAGYRIRYVPEAAVVHRAARSSRQYLPLRWRYGVGQGRFYAKHFDLRDRYMAGRMARELARRLRSLPSLLIRKPGRALGNATYTLGVLVGAAGWLLPPIRGKDRQSELLPQPTAASELARGAGHHGA